MAEAQLWKINCMEDTYPGMWQRWFKKQCVGVGWASEWGYHLYGETKTWSQARNALREIRIGDKIIVALRGHRVGRLGEVTGKAIEDDQWDPLVPVSRDMPEGEMGRRIFVRWDLETGPDDRDQVVRLPADVHFNKGELRQPISEIRSRTLDDLKKAMNDPDNWVGILPQFRYEKSLSDYIAAYPHRLEDGFSPYPDSKIRERTLSNGKRVDVLLLDRKDKPVIVECKQYSPSEADIEQLRGYLKKFHEQTGRRARGILVHGGARKLQDEVRDAASKNPSVELVQYRVEVDFFSSR